MVQGDEPVITSSDIKNIVAHFKNPEISVVNLMSPIISKNVFLDKNNVKVVVNTDFRAMYFSREPIPSAWKGSDFNKYLQTGIIAFRSEILEQCLTLSETPLEVIESVDMNRLLENGISIQMVCTDEPTIGVDTPGELKIAEAIMRKQPESLEY